MGSGARGCPLSQQPGILAFARGATAPLYSTKDGGRGMCSRVVVVSSFLRTSQALVARYRNAILHGRTVILPSSFGCSTRASPCLRPCSAYRRQRSRGVDRVRDHVLDALCLVPRYT